MSFVKVAFKAIDYLFYFNQNGYINKYKDVNIEKDIKYSDKHEDCLLNVHSLENKENKKRPLAIFIHGGGFVAGGKKYRKRYPNFLANLGFVCFNIDYPLSDKMRFHEQVPVIADMLNFIVKNKDKYNIDIENSLVCGDSAGGYMSALVSIMVKNKEFCKKFNTNVDDSLDIKAALLLCGMYDLEKAMVDIKSPGFAQRQLTKYITGIDFKGRPIDLKEYEYNKELLLLNYVDENFPKSFVVHVENDMFCLNQGEYMEKALTQHKVPYSNYVASRKTDLHDFVLCDYKKSTKEAQEKVIKFLKENFNLNK